MPRPDQPRRMALAHLPTPVMLLPGPSPVPGKTIYIWRDDLTEFLGSGNKIRKLEYLLAEATEQQATHLITCGGPQSNHARATVVMARRLGLEVLVIIREPPEGIDRQRSKTGNLLINDLAGAEIRYVAYADYLQKGAAYDVFLAEEADKVRESGGRPYIIPEGGSCPLGCWGYISAAEELARQWPMLETGTDFPDAIFVALGSGGTHVGLHLGLEQLGIPTNRLWAVNVCDDEPYFRRRCGRLLAETRSIYSLSGSDDGLQILDGYVGEGYAKATNEELQSYRTLFRSSGILLDSCYTGKAFRGMVAELSRNPKRFGDHVLFLHSGGLFANFA